MRLIRNIFPRTHHVAYILQFCILNFAFCIRLFAADYTEIDRNYQAVLELMAKSDFKNALPALQNLLPQVSSSMRANLLSDMAVCYKNLGQYDKADTSFRSAIASVRSDDSRQKIKLNYSNFLLEIGDYKNAKEVLSQITASPLLPDRMINMAHAVYMDDGDYALADALLDSCATLCNERADTRFTALQNRGFLLMDQRRFSEAVPFFNQALSLQPTQNRRFQTMGNLALSNAYAGNTTEAQNQINQTITHFARRSDLDYRIALRKGGEVNLLAGNVDEAKTRFHDFFARERKSVISQLPELSAGQRLNLWSKEKPLLSKCFMLENHDADFLFEVALFRRLTSLLGMHDTEALNNLLKVTPETIRRQLGRDGAAVEFVQYTDINGIPAYAAIILPAQGAARFVRLFDTDFLNRPVGASGSSAIKLIKSDFRDDKNTLYNDSTLGNAVWQPILSVLPPRIQKIYFAPEAIFHLWGIEHMPFSGKDNFELHRVTSTTFIPANTRSTSAQKVQYSPSLLVGDLDYSWVPEQSSAPGADRSASDMLLSRLGTTNVFHELPGTRAEIDSIHLVHPEATYMDQAIESRLKDSLPQYRMVHIATHGYSLDMGIRRRPEFLNDSTAVDRSLDACGLALSGANVLGGMPDVDDGILSGREICALDLRDVDFVILSACQTARGDITDEGAAGLVRSLKNAGVRTVVASLWSVDDNSTMLFMQHFHRLLSQGLSRHDAFVGAQNHLRHDPHLVPYRRFSPAIMAKERKTSYKTINYNEPYYWAPFIIIDDI